MRRNEILFAKNPFESGLIKEEKMGIFESLIKPKDILYNLTSFFKIE